MNLFNKNILTLLFIALINSGCGDKFLDVKSDMSVSTPAKLSDYRALLDNTIVFGLYSPRSIALICGEDFWIDNDIWNKIPASTLEQRQYKMAYLWLQEGFYDGRSTEAWDIAYKRILYSNLVLEGVKKYGIESDQQWKILNGEALFHRAWNFYSLSQQFCKTYEEESAKINLGLPLRTESDPTLKVQRSSLKATYEFIINDIEMAVKTLPEISQNKLRPSKAACYALLTRVYLQMGLFDKVLEYANRSLSIGNKLLDYNVLDSTKFFSFDFDFGESNPEVIFHDDASNFNVMSFLNINIDQELLGLYDDNDLRKVIFFDKGESGNIYFKGGYGGSGGFNCGLTTAEMLLASAEAYYRIGDQNNALSDIKKLMGHRYKTGNFNIDTSQLLNTILLERRKELCFRGIRWEDLRRLNKEGNSLISKERIINNTLYKLEPNSKGYVWPIPESAVELGELEQNP